MAGEEVEAHSLHKECLCLLELLLMSSSPLHKQMPEKVETLRLMTHPKKKPKRNRPFPSSPRPLYQDEVKCSAFDVEMIFHTHVNKIISRMKSCALGLISKVGIFGIRKWPIHYSEGSMEIGYLSPSKYVCYSYTSCPCAITSHGQPFNRNTEIFQVKSLHLEP